MVGKNPYFEMQRLWWAVGFIVFTFVIAAGVWWFAYSSALQQVAQQGRADLSSASDRIVGQLQRYRQAAVLTSDHPALMALAAGGGADVQSLLLKIKDQSGALDVSFVTEDGIVGASSNPDFLGQDLSQSRPFVRAMRGALGVDHARINAEMQRAFSFAAPVFSAEGPPKGAVLVRVDMERVEESDWRGAPEIIYFVDDAGMIFISNRSELLFREGNEGAIAHESSRIAGQTIWHLEEGRYLPRRAIHVERPLPVIGMTGEVLISIAPAERIAGLQAAVAVATCLAFGALLFLATERRRTLALANLVLEQRVSERTQALVQANTDLKHEVTERQDAEAQLRLAQEELVQSAKLSALGKMSAGISHELNQPLMAIQSFAENAEAFIERDKPAVAAQNLNRISDLARRMGRIIKNLRAFAKQESEPITDVNICKVVDVVLELSEARLKQEQVSLAWRAPETDIYVRGGDVRLQQVLMNLVSNAVDAMAGQTDKQIEVTMAHSSEKLQLMVRDTGPGIKDVEKIFDPFYSTKAVSQTEGAGPEGMGLGLSISYGLVQSFGGGISGKNHAEGGAVFTIDLTLSGGHRV
ncbi:sensor histidine kinase [Cochlodiniinecator piscidefendens]|uniref:sensor histidine kinase n=1 Tax=Cochlodiniinecator piscidefendens TaxID=2715756 RepID=UPI001E54745B|nr:ATP-binding protein [Cochlodiniinecator piscidefendens]